MSLVFAAMWAIAAIMYAYAWGKGEKIPAWVPMGLCLLLALTWLGGDR